MTKQKISTPLPLTVTMSSKRQREEEVFANATKYAKLMSGERADQNSRDKPGQQDNDDSHDSVSTGSGSESSGRDSGSDSDSNSDSPSAGMAPSFSSDETSGMSGIMDADTAEAYQALHELLRSTLSMYPASALLSRLCLPCLRFAHHGFSFTYFLFLAL